MDGFLQLALTNAAWATVLAFLAAIGARLLRQYPALVHTLWLMVMLKLATPSLVELPRSWGNVPSQKIVAKPVLTGSGETRARLRSFAPSSEVVAGLLKRIGDKTTPPANEQELGIRTEPIVNNARPFPWRQVVVAIWLFGLAVWWVVIGLSSYRFHRLLRSSHAAPHELRERLAQLAACLGLRRVPTVSIVSARIPPMIWAGLVGRPRLVLPEELWSRFDSARQDAVMAHELAHLKRRDHWVRRLEAVVLAMYWWDPIAWWARHELERAEEACCDAWVVWALPTTAGAYAEALVATAVYLSGRRLHLPVGASGAGRVLPLTRRLKMILSDQSTSSLARNVPRAVLVLGILALPFLPGLAAGRTPGGSSSGATPIAEPTDDPKQNAPAAVEKTETKSTAKTKVPATSSPTTLKKVRVSQPMVREVTDSQWAGGRLEAVHQVQLKGRVSGRLEAVRCRPGQMVKKGEVLFEIDPRPYKTEVDKAEAEVRLARSRAKILQSKPPDRGLGAEMEAAVASHLVAEADLDLARLKLESTKVTSPIVGKISGSVLAAGNVVVADTTVLATILSFDPMYISFALGEDTLMQLKRSIRDGKIKADLKSGYPVVVDLHDGDGFKHPAKADFEYGDFNQSNTTFTLRAVMPNPGGFLMPGQSVGVKLATSAPHTAHLLPKEARIFSNTVGPGTMRMGVYVVNSESVVEARDVHCSGQYDDCAAIDAGLKADEWVVIDDIDERFVGKKVEPVKVSLPRKPYEDKLPALLTPADQERDSVPFPNTTAEGQRATP